MMRRFATHAALFVCGVCLLGGSAAAVLGLLVTHTPPSAPLPLHPFALSEGGPPTPSRPSAPKLAADELSIPSLDVVAPLTREVITDHSLTIPGDVHVVGIWSGGGTPGGRVGTVLLAGHVNYYNQGNGALYRLASIQPGAQIYVTTRTGDLDAWTATSLKAYPKADLPQDVFAPSGPRRLVIVTCGGPFDPQSGHYLDNVVLSARPSDSSPSPPRARTPRRRAT